MWILSKRINKALEGHEVAQRQFAADDLPTACPPYSAGAIWEAMRHDKKRQGKRLRWILPHALGRVEINDQVPRELVIAVLRQMGAEGE